MNTFKTLLKVEMRLSIRGMDMLIFAIFMPLTILVILGLIYGQQPAFEGADYTFFQQSFSAISTVSICSGGLMGLPLVVSEYRERKILKKFKVTPVSSVMILIVELAVFSIYSVASLILLLITSTLLFDYPITGSLLNFILIFLLVMLAMFSIGMMVGGVAKDRKVANITASLLYFSMLIFSGATLPYEVMPLSLQRISDFMPLTQGIKLLKNASIGLAQHNMLYQVTLMLTIIVLCTIGSIKFFKWE